MQSRDRLLKITDLYQQIKITDYKDYTGITGHPYEITATLRTPWSLLNSLIKEFTKCSAEHLLIFLHIGVGKVEARAQRRARENLYAYKN